jgi:hypothetical protein
MNISKIAPVLFAAVCLVGSLQGCKSDNDKTKGSVSPALITNPISASGTKNTGSMPEMTFETLKHDFGLMMQGERLEYTYVFTNTGGSDVVISNVSATCGCTIPDWTKTPIKPGEKGQVQVQFNSAGKSGSINKSAKVLANTQPNTIELEFTAEVYVPDSKK